ncbi:NACHT domain-containing protein [Polyangium mundeleinium]|uniref:HEAT repeat domain-containing protein n=1 Tax=Polyangium mundeleinium TaxID=2995306 RepID=A0ABT5F7B9_9BACT|nr:hypothetical protein [Polyangium mundeleinium]MDC0750002.1 hypothetical protein [Polyangium mundeleinium]
MATVGGGADKLGNEYENLWTIDQLLLLVTGEASALRVEPLDRWESQGIEFQVKRHDGTVEHWSSKRQRADAAGWTLDKLTKLETNGRSILGDLQQHIERAPENRGVFVSALAAPKLSELCSFSHDETVFKARLRQSAELDGDFRRYVLGTLCNGDEGRALQFLRSIRIRTIDESTLEDRVDFAVRTLFYHVGGQPTSPVAIRGHLGKFLRSRIHQWIEQPQLLSELEQHEIRRREWAVDNAVTGRIADSCDSYTGQVQAGFINGVFLDLQNDAILSDSSSALARKVLVVADAGGGKSCALAAAVQQLRRKNIPVLAVRFDQLPDGILSTTELGRRLGFPESPAVVLAGVAHGGSCWLVVDQLDAISMASGRRTELWSVFDALRREAERFPRMSILVACRAFDLEHDHRIRSLLSERGGFKKVSLKLLTSTQIDDALHAAGMETARLATKMKELLALPLHLWMYLTLSPESRTLISGKDELFDRFWKEKERRVTQRVGRKVEWTAVIDTLSEWLSNNQQLSAPPEVLDDHATDAEVMISEHVLTQSGGRYRFFHESFFDYAFARSFVRRGKSLFALLVRTEQHLFRRAQVRQILTYLRMKGNPRYLSELEALLLANEVRFHVKRVALPWLASLPDPTVAEWLILQKIAQSRPELRLDIVWMGAGNVAWFDLRNEQGWFSAALSSGDEERECEAVQLLGIEAILIARSPRVAQILRHCRKRTDRWNDYLREVCRFGRFYHDRALFELFLDMIDEGVLDPSPTSSVNWSSMLHELPRKRPEYACEVIAHWFDRSVALWRHVGGKGVSSDRPFEERTISAADILEIAGSACGRFVELMLPRVAALVEELAEPHEEILNVDSIWSFRAYGDDPHDAAGAVLVGLAQAMEHMARNTPDILRRYVAPYLGQPHDTIAYLVLRAWTAAPDVYADDLADYLAADQRRLHVGYSICGSSGGSGRNHISCRAVEAASPRCSVARFAALEKAILGVKTVWESKRPQARGWTQLELLLCMDPKRLTPDGQAAHGMLLAKFPDYRHAEPQPMRVVTIGSPLKDDAREKMTDEHWLKAMRKYSGIDYRNTSDLSGGERELATAIELQAKRMPLRFIMLAEQMPDDFPASYFDAILRGAADCRTDSKDASELLREEDAARLIFRVHSLPGRRCGRWISWLIKKVIAVDWPDGVLEAMSWYAMHDPDPERELWKGPEGYYRSDPYTAGINSTRGAAAGAIAHVLFQQPERLEMLRPAIESLVHDRSAAVRTCAVDVLLAVLRASVPDAIKWFGQVIETDPAILATPPVQKFIHYGGYHDYPGLRDVILGMLDATDPEVVEVAATQICVLDLSRGLPAEDVERVRGGNETMRKAAANVYATNVAHSDVGPVCRDLLVPFFSDLSAPVRSAAAKALSQLSSLDTADQAKLLTEFVHAKPGVEMMEAVMWALEDSPVKLPDLVCQIAETCLSQLDAMAEDGSRVGRRVASHLPKIVVRLYAQATDAAIQSRCLDMIDAMEKDRLMGVDDELRTHDR